MVRAGAVLILTFVVTAGVAAQKKGGDPKLAALKNPVAATAASINTGRAVSGKQRRHCHGVRGDGDGPLAPKTPRPSNLTDATWDHGGSDGEIFTIILNCAPAANSEMKPMKGTIADKDIWNIVNFLRTIGPKTGAGTAGAGTAKPPATAKPAR
jgi:mono/diheme cytochrome c family protein